jgi:hypothetical protein
MIDETLVRRLERAEARNVLGCAEARAEWHGFQHSHIWIAGGRAIFAGHWTHLTQAVALGVSGPIEAGDVHRISGFFRDRYAVPTANVPDRMPWVLAALANGGYKELGAVNVLARRISAQDLEHQQSQVQVAVDEDSWIRACSQGFRQKDDIEPADLEIGAAAARCDGAVRLQVCADEEIAGTAAFGAYAHVGMFFADSTRAQFAGGGVQSSLIRARLAHARLVGCDVATCQVAPGSASERNYLRHGFQLLYTRVTMQTPN